MPSACSISTVFAIACTRGWLWTITCTWWSRRWRRGRWTRLCTRGGPSWPTCWYRADAAHRCGDATSMTASCAPTASCRRRCATSQAIPGAGGQMLTATRGCSRNRNHRSRAGGPLVPGPDWTGPDRWPARARTGRWPVLAIVGRRQLARQALASASQLSCGALSRDPGFGTAPRPQGRWREP